MIAAYDMTPVAVGLAVVALVMLGLLIQAGEAHLRRGDDSCWICRFEDWLRDEAA